MIRVAEIVERARERLPKLEAHAKSYENLMSASDSEVRIYNLNTLPNPAYKKDAVYLKLAAVKSLITKEMVASVGSNCRDREFYAGHFSREFIDGMASMLIRREISSREYQSLVDISEAGLKDILKGNAGRVVDDVKREKNRSIPYQEFEQKVYSAIRRELFAQVSK